MRLGRLLNERRVGRRHDAGPQLTLLLLQPLRDLKVKFDSNMATKIMAGENAVATNLIYQLKIGVESASAGGPPRPRGGAPPSSARMNERVRIKNVRINESRL